MYGNSYSKFIKYSNLNEISKFVNFNNLFLLSNIKKVTVWFSVDLSVEKSRLSYYSKGLLGTFLIYLITNKYPVVKTSKDQRILYVECSLLSSDLISFLEKFLIIYNDKQRKNIIKTLKIEGNFIRLLVTDLNFFSELRSSANLFSLVEWLHIDIYCNHRENYRNLIFLDNLVKSSYLIQ
jgi:hypothetical protein